jgi:hypothetical protein
VNCRWVERVAAEGVKLIWRELARTPGTDGMGSDGSKCDRAGRNGNIAYGSEIEWNASGPKRMDWHRMGPGGMARDLRDRNVGVDGMLGKRMKVEGA